MKKLYLLFVMLVYFVSSFGQNSLAPCNEFNPSNAFENGWGYSTGNNLKTANDLTVNPNENFELRQIVYNSFHNPSEFIVDVNIVFYEDDGGLPGVVVGNELNVVPTSQIEIGDFGIEVTQVTLDLTPFVFSGQLNVDTIYWIELNGTSSSGGPLHWEVTSASVNGYPSALSSGGVYHIIDPSYDGVYTFSGECENILGVQNSLEELISIYPNPVSNKLNISMLNGLEVFEVLLYDVLGNKTLYESGVKELNLEMLPQGMYFLKITTSEGNLTKKIIKK